MALTLIEDGIIADSILTVSKLVTTGTASSTTVLKGDFSWAAGATTSGKWNAAGSAPGTPVAGDVWYTGGVIYIAVAAADAAAAWSIGGSLNTRREQGTGTGTQTASLSCCGSTPAGTYTGTSETYDGSTWSAITDTPTGRAEMPGAAGTTSAGLVFGGVGPSAGDNTQEWSGSAWTTGGTIAAAQGQGGATYGCGTQTAALKMAGETSTPWTKSGEYDGTSWTTGGTLNTVRRWNAGAGIQTAAVVFGGRGNGSPLYQNSTEEYNGSTWTAVNNMITGEQEGGGAGLQTAALSIGGKTAASTSHSTQTQTYDGTSWATANTLVVSMKYNMCGTGSTTASLNNGGNDGTAQLTVTQEWNRVGQFNAKNVGYG